jgi:hypothetical protein
MSVIDKVNQELLALEAELNKLQSFTNEIGKARDASEQVIAGSKEFVSNFKNRIDTISRSLEDASSSFTLKSEASYNELEKVASKLQTQTQKAEKTLQDIGVKLEGTADGINAMAKKIDSINIMEHFDKLHLSQERLEKNIKQIQKDQNQRIEEIKALLESNSSTSKLRHWLLVLILMSSIFLQIGIVAMKFIKW